MDGKKQVSVASAENMAELVGTRTVLLSEHTVLLVMF
jgi:hypothetical protein